MTDVSGPGRNYLPAIVLTVSLFFLWGVANNLNDILIKQFGKAFVLNDLQAGLVQSAFYLGYFFLAIPAAVFMRARGYKAAIVLGLVLYGIGALLFYPAAEMREYAFFLGALFVIASGLAFLETSANPLMTELGDPATAARRLNLAQSFNPLGSITGVVLGQQFILSGIEHDAGSLGAMTATQIDAYYRMEAQAVQTPYLVLGVLVLLFALTAALIPFPTGRAEAGETQEDGRFGALRQHPRLWAAVVAQFFYVGAQVGIWSFIIRFAQTEVPGMGERTAAGYLTASLVLLMIGRFAGTALMGRVAPSLLLAAFAGVNVVLSGFAAMTGGMPGLIALVATSFFMSIQFPTIFALGVEGLGAARKAGASLIVMAIIGGAVLTPLMGWVSGAAGIATAMLVPAACFVVILLFALSTRRGEQPSASALKEAVH